MIISIFLLLSSHSIFAQGLEEPFTAKEAINEVFTRAKSEGINEPVLVGIGIAPGEYVIPGFGALKSELDMTNGQASIWLYMIAEKTDITNTINIGVIKFFNGFLSMKIDIDLSSIPINYINPIVINWIDTDVLCQKLNSNSIFSGFVKDDQAIFDFVTLDYQDAGELDGMGDLKVGAYWLLSCSKENGESVMCYTNALTGATTCFNLTDVEDETSENSFKVFPNPAKDNLYIENLNLSENIFDKVYIIDSNGYIIDKCNLTDQNINTVNIQNLPNGTYTILIGNSFKRFVKVN